MNAFDAGALYLEKHDWTRNTIQDAQGKVCALGALQFSGCPRVMLEWFGKFLAGRTPVLIQLTRYDVRYRVGDACKVIPFWNDNIAKDRAEVIAMFRDASAQWDEEHPPRPLEYVEFAPIDAVMASDWLAEHAATLVKDLQAMPSTKIPAGVQ